MDSNKIKRLAMGARTELMAMASARLDAVLTDGSDERLADPEAVRRLEGAVRRSGRAQVAESAAYTWFNRLCALRYMDVCGYTPTAVVTPRPGSTQPAVLADAAQGVFDPEFGFPQDVRERVRNLLSGESRSGNATEDAYGELLCAVCEHYAKPMGYLFSENAASRLLMPQGLLSEGSILRRIVEDMDDEECESVEVMGWLYQYYIAERKDEVFAGFKDKKKAGAAEIPAATQLFTPEWIVRYLAENSLGRLWMLNNPASRLAERMDYYVAPEGDEEYVKISGTDEIRVLDPACGSGHILVYAFDLLFAMYEEEGWPAEDIPAMILKNNLKGLEIDGRAAELAKFALEMKAREHDPRFFEKNVDADVTVLRPVTFGDDELPLLSQGFKERADLLDALAHMDEVGSLYVPRAGDGAAIEAELGRIAGRDDLLMDSLRGKLETALADVAVLSGAYHCVIANPPYMGSGNMNPWLSGWVKESYPDEKSDLCTCFIRRGQYFSHRRGYFAEITMQSWMFESSFEKFRVNLVNTNGLLSLCQLGIRAFKDIGNDVVQTVAFVFMKDAAPSKPLFIKLDECKNYEMKRFEYFNNEHRFSVDILAIKKIPGFPLTAYSADPSLLKAWDHCESIDQFGEFTGSQNVTGDNDKYLRFNWEVSRRKVGYKSGYWIPYAKGGSFRKYYGNIVHVVDWRDEARLFYSTNKSSNLLAKNLWYKPGITYSAVTSRGTGFRYLPPGCVFDKGGASIIINKRLYEILGLMNSKVASALFSILNPSVNLQVRDIKALPIKLPSYRPFAEHVERLVRLAESDWDDRETSLDYRTNCIVAHKGNDKSIEETVAKLSDDLSARRAEALLLSRSVDEALCKEYGIAQDVLPEYESRDIPPREFDLLEEVKSLVSYAVGCMFGRYSLDVDGLVLADQGATVGDYLEKVPNPTFMPDADNVIPVLDGYWFEDNAVDIFYQWLAAVYGEETLEENVAWLQDALGCDLATYFSKHFYKDHLKTYQKRPIYWMFESPKKSFRCLIYMHRYNEGTVGEVLAKYVRPFEDKLRSRIGLLETSDRARDVREATKLKDALDDVEGWERDVLYDLAHERVSIDLDDGVKVNYNKFPHALAKVSGLSEWK